MKTQILKIIKALYCQNHFVAQNYAAKMRDNYLSGKILESDKSLAKRILNIFYETEEQFKPGENYATSDIIKRDYDERGWQPK